MSSADQCDVGRFHGNIGTTTDGEADVGSGQGRCIVDAIADHAYLFAGGLQFTNDSQFVGRRAAGQNTVDTDLTGDMVGHGLDIAGCHDRLQAQAMEQGDGLGSTGASAGRQWRTMATGRPSMAA